jgi:hypothetical protein
MRKKPITAGELLEQLAADPEYQARMAKKQAEFDKRDAELERAEQPLLKALAAIGINVTTVYDLVNTRLAYQEALPVLLEHLQRPYPVEIREGIARALAVRGARFAWHRLRELYAEEEDPRMRDVLALAVGNSADQTVLDQVISLARDPQHGNSRLMLLFALKRFKRDPRAWHAIQDLATDPTFAYEIGRYLKGREKRKANKAS